MDTVANRTIASVLDGHALHSPDRPFLLFVPKEGSPEEISYGEALERSYSLACQLAYEKVRPGDRVHVQLGNCPETVLLLLACAHLGATLVPTSPESTEDEISYILEHSGACLSYRDRREIRVMAWTRWTTKQRWDPKASEVLEILYTSGTTSRPKGVVITHSAAIHAAECMARATALRSDDRHLISLPLHHAAAQFHTLMPTMLVGGTAILTERFSASGWFDQVLEFDATAAALFAAPVRMILAQPCREAWAHNRLRFVTYAQNLTQEQWNDWHERYGAPLVQLWGMTETVGLPLMNPLSGRREPMSMGRPVPGYECAVVDEAGMALPLYDEERTGVDPHDEIGELVVFVRPGVNAMLEYYRDPAATAATLRPLPQSGRYGPTHVLYTGDRAYADSNGYFYFVDRAKDMIKRSGENIAPAEVEAVLKAHPDILDAAVVGVHDPVREEAVKAFLILRAHESPPSAEAIKAWCASRLAPFKVPEFWEFRTEFPRTSVGKIQKHLLK